MVIYAAPSDLSTNSFAAWRKVLKDLITYFRDVQKSYDGRAKSLQSAFNAINNANMPAGFLTHGGLGDAIHILTDYNRQSLAEGNKAKEIEAEIISQLTGLRSDLQQKIKEIKSLSGDFKSSVDKEQEATKRAVRALQEALGSVDHDSAASSGKGDPFIVKMGVDRQVEKQIDEENYLHRVSYLSLFPCMTKHLNSVRHISTSSLLVASLSQLLSARSRRHTAHMLVS